jgi:hypothetical protein
VVLVNDSLAASRVADVRAAFARGLSAASARLLLEARDEGLDWEPVTQAAAAGLAEHYGRLSASDMLADARLPTCRELKRKAGWG